MEGFFIFVFIAGGVIALIVWSVQHAKKVRQNWALFAQQNGLQYSGGISASSSPHIAGWYGRTHITLNTVTRGSGKNRSTYTQFNAHVNVPMPQGLNLTREGMFNKVGKFFGGQDVQLGDQQLDDAFLIKAHDVMGAFSLMRIPQVKQALLTFLARHPNMQLNERHLMFEENGVLGDMARMKVGVDDLAYLCQTLEAGYNQLAGTTGAARGQGQTQARPARTKSLSNPGMRPAATAEILGGAGGVVTSALAQRQLAEAQAAMAMMENKAQTTLQRAEADILQTNARHDAEVAATARAQREAEATMRQTGNRPVPADSQRRRAAETAALSQMASAFHQLEAKMEDHGAFRAQDVAAESSGAFSANKASEFAVGDAANAFAAPPAGDAFKVAASDAFASTSSSPFSTSKFEPPKYEAPKFEAPKFAPATPAATPANTFGASNFGTFEVKKEAAPANEEAVSFDDLVSKLSQSGLFSSDREKMLARYKDRVFILKVEVTRVERTFGFDLPDKLRDGRTIEGQVQGKDIKVAARYPASENARLDRLQSGVTLEVQGSLAGWDDLFKKATLNGF